MSGQTKTIVPDHELAELHEHKQTALEAGNSPETVTAAMGRAYAAMALRNAPRPLAPTG